MSSHDHSVTFAESQQYIIDPTNSRGALDDGVEYRLYVCGRAADNPKHLGRRRLMLQSFSQCNVAFLEFLKQSYVLDRVYCLVGARFKESDLFVRERTDVSPADRYGTDRHTLAQKRRRHRRSDTKLVRAATRDFAPVRMLNFAPCHCVLNVYCLPVEYGTAGEEVTADCR